MSIKTLLPFLWVGKGGLSGGSLLTCIVIVKVGQNTIGKLGISPLVLNELVRDRVFTLTAIH